MESQWYTNGILASGFDGGNFDANTQSFTSVLAYLQDKTGKSYYTAPPTNAATTNNNAVTGSTAGPIMDYSNTLIKNLQDEYCFHKVRYDAVLKKFLESLTPNSTSQDQVNDYLGVTVHFNKRMNAMIQIIDYIAKAQIPSISGRAGTNDDLNGSLKDFAATFEKDKAVLMQEQAVIRTRKEMIRFTQEKNNHIANQISLWAALNILAIGAIFHIYRSM